MKKSKLISAIAFLLAILLFYAGYGYIYKEHRDISNEKAVITKSATKLYSLLIENENTTSKEYIDKTVIVNGKVTEVDENTIVLNNKIQVVFKNNFNRKLLNKSIIIKGRYIGFDDLLELIKIDQATQINK